MHRKIVVLLVALVAAFFAGSPAFARPALVWTDHQKISFTAIDGSRGGDITVSGTTVAGPAGIAVDPTTHKMYWANMLDSDSSIAFANVDGSAGGFVNTAGAIVFTPAAVALDPAAGRIYWANASAIWYASLYGTGGGSLGTIGTTVAGLAVDPAGGKLYWTDGNSSKISYLNLDGSGGGDLVISGATLNSPAGLAIDPVARRIYWTNGSADKISFANLDGTGGVDMNTTGASISSPSGLAIDVAGGRIYWTNVAGKRISFANLNGSGGGDLDAAGMASGADHSDYLALFDLFPIGDLIGHKSMEACWSRAVSQSGFLGVLQSAIDDVTSCIPQSAAPGYAFCGEPHCPGNATGCSLTTHAVAFSGPPQPVPDFGNPYTSSGTTDDIVIDVAYSGGSCTITASSVTVDYALDFGLQADGNNGLDVVSLDPPSFAINGYTLSASDATCQFLADNYAATIVAPLETQGRANIAALEKAVTDGKSICPLSP